MTTFMSEATTANSKPLRVMVVEDEALVAMLVEDELLDAGATVLCIAASVAEALRVMNAAMADSGLDACLLDMNLGGESAIPVADALAREDVPFLFMTGYDDIARQGDHAGRPTLHKPFNPRELITAMNRMLAYKAMRCGSSD
jgi:DNA-binding response OmpR family regulator